MQYVGIQTQQSRNNIRSLILLCLFPCLVIGLVLLFCFLLVIFPVEEGYEVEVQGVRDMTMQLFAQVAPYAIGGVLIWFTIAYFANVAIINSATSSHSLLRKENKRVYNLVENLCMSQGMKTPKVNVIEDNSLNAFASGINQRTYTVTLSRGIINKLNDEELEAVVAHELSHIRNHDVRLLIISIVFVGIFAMLAEIAIRTAFYSGGRSRNNKGGGGVVILLIVALVAAMGFLFSSLMRFAISRKREYLADAGAAGMTKRPWALASALRKISADPDIEAVTRDDIAQLFIEHPGKHVKGMFSGLFATHPPIKKRIQILEQF